MTVWYRASQISSPQVTFSGDGGLYVAGRWNYLGKRVIYCSESIALCTLEWLAHNGLSVSDFNYYRYAIEIPDHLVTKFNKIDLPKEWNVTPATDMTRDFAEKKLFLSDKNLAIAIPSVIIPEEFNLVINPLHNAFSQLVKAVKALGLYTAPNRDN
jgi:RES domain-containing protein